MCRPMKLFNCFLLIAIFCFGCQKNYNADAVEGLPVNADEVAETSPPVLHPVTKYINNAVGGYYVGLPARYDLTTKIYPLLVFLPGGGQIGNGQLDLTLLLNDGIMQLLDEKKFPPAFTVKGKTYSFITVTPQFSYYPSDAEVESFIAYVKKTYRVDNTRIYLSGLSMGGFITSDMGAVYTSQFAAIVPIAGVISDSGLAAKAANIARGNLPVWIFHNNGDPVNNVSMAVNFYASIQSNHPAIAPKLTLFPDKVHDAWTKTINPNYKENGMNIYQWMLQYAR